MEVILDNKMKMKFVQVASEFIYDLEVLGKLINEEEVNKYILSELDELLELNKRDIMKARFKHFNISKTKISDYEQKLIKIGKTDKFVLAGIRHMGGNANKPFIYIWPNFMIKQADIKDIVKNVYPYFKVFKPLHINFWINPILLSKYELDEKFFTVQQSFIGNVIKLNSKNSTTAKSKFKLEQVKSSEYYKWYKNEYNNFHIMNPDMKERIPINDIELMEKCRKENLLYYGVVNNKKVGIIAAEKNDVFGLKGIYINEIMIAKDYRGNKYSELLLSHFINILPKFVEVLWCNIDCENIPSTKTAIYSGQEVFSVECFYQL